ncbi:ribosome-inactivating protein [Xylariaceae sp. FL1019]|nr:ribosome-inactivating protein [Xylariaceae sp. FL1019]
MPPTMQSFTYNVADDWNGEQYRKLLQDIRNDLKVSEWTSLNIPVLAPQTPEKMNGVDVVLSAYSQTITLRLRRDNVYLEGYQQGSGPWYEFKYGKAGQMIPNSTQLSYGGSYPELEEKTHGHSGHKEGGNRSKYPLGHQPLIEAVNVLGKGPKKGPSGGPEQIRAPRLLVVIQMICEAIRFREIENLLVENWTNTVCPTVEIMKLETSWANKSEYTQKLDRNAGSQEQLVIPGGSKDDVWTVERVSRVVAIMLYTRGPKVKPRL